jgi:hypothetical protein
MRHPAGTPIEPLPSGNSWRCSAPAAGADSPEVVAARALTEAKRRSDAPARSGTSNIAATRAPPPFAGAMIVIPTTGVAAMWAWKKTVRRSSFSTAPLTGSGPVK